MQGINLILDTSILIHSNYHILKKHNNHVDLDDLFDRIIESVNTIKFAINRKKYLIKNTIFLLDSDSFRKEIDFNYKNHRVHDESLKSLLNFVYTKLEQEKFT